MVKGEFTTNRYFAAKHAYSDTFESLVQNETFLPSQYRDQHKSSELSGEQRLLWAILIDAIQCFQFGGRMTDGFKYPGSKRTQLHLEAKAWLLDESKAPFTFVGLCNALGKEPEYFRKPLLAWLREYQQAALDRAMKVENPAPMPNAWKIIGSVNGCGSKINPPRKQTA